ncbi:unnamed protein product [Mytilus coruscus]|uniref:Reverse transcriptase RNase H-like domain-containing protein n=1 Tax=Mytilus coruscus TaxID=42192 RepID=A0A6J8CPH5_MYTCO|nr:unnamed protein product [Mytilus coruscus]
MIRDNEDIFATSDKDLGCTDTVQMTIDTGDHPPIKLKPYRAPLNQRKIIDKAIEELLEANIIRKSRSAWAAPIIIVSKKDKTSRMCVDYRSLNAASKIYSFPLPLIDDLLASVDPEKVKAIQGMKAPSNVREVRGLIGCLSYYRRFVPSFSKIAEPIVALTRKNKVFDWTNTCQVAFEKLRGELVKVPLLAYPDLNKPYVLYTDASDNCVGSCLTQVQESPIKGENEVERPIYFLSHKLSDTQTRWSTIEKEAFAIHYALQKLNHYLYNAEFVIKTDHKPLKYIIESPMQNKKIQLWALNITGYNCTIQYIPGPQNVCADFMSRLPSDEKQNENPDPYPDISDNTYEINVINSNRFHFTDYANNDKLVEDIPEKEKFQFEEFDMSIEQVKDKTLRELKEQLVSDKVPEAVQNKYIIIDDILYYISNVDNDPIIRDPVLPLDNILKPRRKYYGRNIIKLPQQQQHKSFMLVHKTMKKSKQKQAKYANKHSKDIKFEVGNPVFYKNHRRASKLSRKWTPYYRIIEQTSPVSFILKNQLDGTTTKAHAEQIRLAKLDWEIPNNNQGKALRKAAYVVPVESQSEDSSDDESIDSDTPLNQISKRYKKERENSDEEDDIPLMELSKKLRGKKIFSEPDKVSNSQIESDDQVIKEEVENSPSDSDVSDIDDNMSITHPSPVASEISDMEDNMSVNRVKIKNNRKSPDIGANETKLALSFLFGTVSDSDLSKIRRNIKTLAQNQDAIRHIVQDGLTILNTTQTHVSENRHKVNELIESVQDLGNRLKTFATDLENKLKLWEVIYWLICIWT